MATKLRKMNCHLEKSTHSPGDKRFFILIHYERAIRKSGIPKDLKDDRAFIIAKFSNLHESEVGDVKIL